MLKNMHSILQGNTLIYLNKYTIIFKDYLTKAIIIFKVP